ncbi:MAG TPA: ParB/RepB/Spo0J family partition protein [Methylomirabilota bacterium]|jgi:ParB family chromosome partitioning protein|nr:ParB/RepB/Spo0J family partition protein [Methylomirabilota bacterium]
MNKRGLGRGLDALLGSASSSTESLTEIPVDQIDANPRQPRRAFDPASLDELAKSLKSAGMIQPVVVRRTPEGRWQLIAGERRWRAARQAGLERIPAVVREATDAESLELALVENLLREDLNPMEEADAYQQIVTEFGWTQEELAQRVGRDRSTIANCLRLLRLPRPIQEDLRAGRLTMGHARALLSLTDPAEQLKLRDEILAHSWSVRATEEGVEKRRALPSPARRRSVELAALEEAMQRALMTRVKIRGTERRGRIEITYATPDELERLAATFGIRV